MNRAKGYRYLRAPQASTDDVPATLDDLLDKLCRWHVVINLMAFLRGFPVTFNIMMSVFTAPTNIAHVCTNLSSKWINGTSSPQSQCFYVPEGNGSGGGTAHPVPCSSWTYDREVYGRTIVEEWDMVCDQSWLLSLSQSSYLAGVMLGTVVFSHCSDWFGRKQTVLFGILLSGAAGICTAFASSFSMYIIGRVGVAFGISAFGDIIYTLVMETVSPRYRYLPTLSMGLGFCLGLVALPWVAYEVRDWQAMQLYVSFPLGIMLLLWLYLPESPRWQLATGRYEEARENLLRLAECNCSPEFVVDEVIESAQRKRSLLQDTKKGTFVDLFSSRKRAILTTVFSLQLSVSSMVWYYTTASTASVGSSPYVSFAIASVTEVPVKMLNVLLVGYCPRRWVTFCTFSVVTVVLVGLIILPHGYPSLELSLLILGKMCSSANSASFRTHISEAYPTVVRTVALGVCITLGRSGTVIAPFFDDLGAMTFRWVPKAVTAALCFICALVSALTPETFKMLLEDNIAGDVTAGGQSANKNWDHTVRRHKVTRV